LLKSTHASVYNINKFNNFKGFADMSCMRNLLIASIFLLSLPESFAKDCGEGLRWYSHLNQCLRPSELGNIEERAENFCAGKTGEERGNCYKDIAKQAKETEMSMNEDLKQNKSNQGFVGRDTSSAIATTFMAANAWFVADKWFGLNFDENGKVPKPKHKKFKFCSPSIKVLALTSFGTFLHDQITNWDHRKKSKKIIRDYENKVKNAGEGSRSSEDLQVAAFNSLIDQEMLLHKNLKTKGFLNTASTAAYATAGILAVKEIVSNESIGAAECLGEETKEPKLPTQSMYTPNSEKTKKDLEDFIRTPQLYSENEVYIIFKNALSIIIPNAHAKVDFANLKENFGDFAKNTLKKIKVGAGKLNNAINWAYKTPYSRVAIAGLMATYSGVVAAKNFREAKRAKDRAKAIEEIRNKLVFNGNDPNFSNCSEQDKVNPSKPVCYCYLEDGSQNPQRQNSDTCKITWGKAWNLTPTDYSLSDAKSRAPRGCMSINGAYDALCECRKKKNKKGENACMKLKGAMKFFGPNPPNWAKSMYEQNAALMAGELGDASLGEIENGQREAFKAMKTLDAYKAKKLGKKDNDKIRAFQGNLERATQRTLAANPSFLSSIGANAMGSNLASTSGDPQEESKENLKKKAMNLFNNGGIAQGYSAPKQDDFSFDFNDNGDSAD
jgi:hypothetical protein